MRARRARACFATDRCRSVELAELDVQLEQERLTSIQQAALATEEARRAAVAAADQAHEMALERHRVAMAQVLFLACCRSMSSTLCCVQYESKLEAQIQRIMREQQAQG